MGFDAEAYLRLAYGLSHHGRYELSGVSTALYPPGYPVLLALLQVFKLNHFTELLVAMAVLGTGTTLLIAQLGRRIGGDTVGLVAGAIAALYPNLFLAEGALMTEALTALLVTVALILALRAIDSPSPRRFLVLGLPLAYGALTRSDGWLFAVLLVATVAWCGTSSPRDWRRFAALCAAGLIASVVFVGAWVARDEAQMHAFVPVAVNSWDVIAGANCAVPTAAAASARGMPHASSSTRPSTPAGGARSRSTSTNATAASTTRGSHLGRLPVVVAARLGLTFGAYDPWRELDGRGQRRGPGCWRVARGVRDVPGAPAVRRRGFRAARTGSDPSDPARAARGRPHLDRRRLRQPAVPDAPRTGHRRARGGRTV